MNTTIGEKYAYQKFVKEIVQYFKNSKKSYSGAVWLSSHPFSLVSAATLHAVRK